MTLSYKLPYIISSKYINKCGLYPVKVSKWSPPLQKRFMVEPYSPPRFKPTMPMLVTTCLTQIPKEIGKANTLYVLSSFSKFFLYVYLVITDTY